MFSFALFFTEIFQTFYIRHYCNITFVCIFTAANNLKSKNDENPYSFRYNP